MNILQSIIGRNTSTSNTPASPNRVIGRVSPGGQAIAAVHGTNRNAGSTRAGAQALGVGTRYGGQGGNAR